jgi:hypothetical protein
MAAVNKLLNLLAKGVNLKAKELSGTENSVPVAASSGHVDKTLIRNVLEIVPYIHLGDKGLVIVIEADYQFLDSPCNFGQPVKVLELAGRSPCCDCAIGFGDNLGRCGHGRTLDDLYLGGGSVGCHGGSVTLIVGVLRLSDGYRHIGVVFVLSQGGEGVLDTLLEGVHCVS